MNSNDDKNKFKCEVCPRSFPTFQGWRVHTQKMHPEITIQLKTPPEVLARNRVRTAAKRAAFRAENLTGTGQKPKQYRRRRRLALPDLQPPIPRREPFARFPVKYCPNCGHDVTNWYRKFDDE
jgi:hypothetical protein